MADNKNNKGINRSSLGATKMTKPRIGDGEADLLSKQLSADKNTVGTGKAASPRVGDSSADLLAKQLNVENARIAEEKREKADAKKAEGSKPASGQPKPNDKPKPGAKPKDKKEPDYDAYHNRESLKEHHGYYYTVGPNGKPVRRRLRTGSGYEQADVNKQKGFSQLVSERMMQGQGIKGSLKGGGKDIFNAYLTSLKKLKDPMNYLSKLPGGLGKIAATAWGMKHGRAKEDITYYTGVHAPPELEQDQGSPGATEGGTGPTATKMGRTKSTYTKDGGTAAFPKVVARHIMKISKNIVDIQKNVKALVLQGKNKNSPASWLEKIYDFLVKTNEKETTDNEISKELSDAKEVPGGKTELDKTEKSPKKSIFEKLKNIRKPKTSGIGAAGAKGAAAASGAEAVEGLAAGGEAVAGGAAVVEGGGLLALGLGALALLGTAAVAATPAIGAVSGAQNDATKAAKKGDFEGTQRAEYNSQQYQQGVGSEFQDPTVSAQNSKDEAVRDLQAQAAKGNKQAQATLDKMDIKEPKPADSSTNIEMPSKRKSEYLAKEGYTWDPVHGQYAKKDSGFLGIGKDYASKEQLTKATEYASGAKAAIPAKTDEKTGAATKAATKVDQKIPAGLEGNGQLIDKIAPSQLKDIQENYKVGDEKQKDKTANPTSSEEPTIGKTNIPEVKTPEVPAYKTNLNAIAKPKPSDKTTATPASKPTATKSPKSAVGTDSTKSNKTVSKLLDDDGIPIDSEDEEDLKSVAKSISNNNYSSSEYSIQPSGQDILVVDSNGNFVQTYSADDSTLSGDERVRLVKEINGPTAVAIPKTTEPTTKASTVSPTAPATKPKTGLKSENTPTKSVTPKLTPTEPSGNKLAARANAATAANKDLTGPGSNNANAPIIVNAPTINSGGNKPAQQVAQGPTPIRNDEPVLCRVQYQNVRPV